jgi:hypothetical protein
MVRILSQRLILGLIALLTPLGAQAQRQLPVNIGTALSVEAILTNIINYMALAIIFVAAASFVVGAFFITFSRGDPDQVNRGKSLLIGSLIGMGVVLGSFAILRTVLFFIYV